MIYQFVYRILIIIGVFMISLHSSYSQEQYKVPNDSTHKASLREFNIKKDSKFEKGDFFIGGNLSFGGLEGENDFIIANVDLIDVDKQNFNVSFIGGYFINPVTSFGYRGKYSYVKNQQTLEADFLNISFNATTYRTQVVRDRYESHIFMRNYVPIGKSGNFYVASETSVFYSISTSYQRATRNPGMADESISTIFSETSGMGAGVGLGFTYFTSPKLAFELQLGAIGVEYKWKDVLKDKVDEGNSKKFTFRDGISVLNVQVGFTYYFFGNN
ncbi:MULTISPECIES: hypothetical protein [unclassified Carboxylicivirga]|uniref:hypothetical protein n=1 Tax=Carboxylicivirga TaxID=1628153 RepID=UPI003D34D63E